MDALSGAASSGPRLALVEVMRNGKNRPGTADHFGQAAGGIGGVIAGAAMGTAAGPVGVLLGGIAGAIGGWWSGRAIAEAAGDITEDDDAYYRADLERRRRPRDGYETVRGAYYLGDIAAANPAYAAREFEDVEADLARGWDGCRGDAECWDDVRELARVGFRHGRERRRVGRERI